MALLFSGTLTMVSVALIFQPYLEAELQAPLKPLLKLKTTILNVVVIIVVEVIVGNSSSSSSG